MPIIPKTMSNKMNKTVHNVNFIKHNKTTLLDVCKENK